MEKEMRNLSEKRPYERPGMLVVELEHQAHLLQASKPAPFIPGGDPFAS